MTSHTRPLFSHHMAAVAAVAAVCATLLGTGFVASAHAQSAAGKTVVVEPTHQPPAIPTAVAQPEANASAPFVVFTQWVQHTVTQAPTVWAAPAAVQPFQPTVAGFAAPFEAAPVILGQPDLPLLGQAAARAAQQWNSGLNYQGANISYVVLSANGRSLDVRPISKGLVAGERFKIRYTTTFDAVASLDRVVGDSPWTGSRVGQAWPQAGMAIQSAPGETVELPLEAGSFFSFDGNPNERLVLSLRHPNAKGAARSNQPAYRQDGARGSQYLQLVPANTFPALEQVIAPRGLTRSAS